MQPVGIEAIRSIQQRRHLFGEPRPDRLRLAARDRFGALRQRHDLGQTLRQQQPKVSPSRRRIATSSPRV